MLKLGIVGLPNVGKPTLFNALTAARAEAANYPFCTVEPNVGMVEVPDDRRQGREVRARCSRARVRLSPRRAWPVGAKAVGVTARRPPAAVIADDQARALRRERHRSRAGRR